MDPYLALFAGLTRAFALTDARYFTALEYATYGGVTALPPNALPLLCETEGITVIADALGVEVTLYADAPDISDGDAFVSYRKMTVAHNADGTYADGDAASYALALFEVTRLTGDVTEARLAALGYTLILREVNGESDDAAFLGHPFFSADPADRENA